ncbi:MAG: DUF4388 domain-containing protein [Thiothrix sp.]|nr:MAG: DUF4388 domain-containing protein [Thiothrix sp.]
MANSSILYPLATVLKQLSLTLSSQRSGTFLIATEQNTSCRFAIERGRITHCTHSRDKGVAAIFSLLQVKQASCAFSESLMLPFRAEAAVTHEFCVATLDLQTAPFAEQTDLTQERLADPSPKAVIESSSSKPRNRFYRGGYALGENDALV